MRTRSVMLVICAATAVSVACGNGNGRAPSAPSAITAAAPSAAGAHNAVQVSWACFTSTGQSALSPAGCGTHVTTSRLLPAANATAAPDAPTALAGTVSGTVVTLSWTAATTGDAPTSYQIQAGSAAGQTNIASFDTGTTATTLAIFNVPAGTYFVRVRAVNSLGASVPSNEVQIVVGGPAACPSVAAPTGLLATINGTTVTLSWTAPTASACAPTGYIIQAGSTPGASDLANFSTGSAATTFTAAGVGAGTYYVRVLSAATGVVSAPSTEIAFTVGTCGTAPNAPTNLQAVINGSTVVFTWTAPAAGCAPVSYLLQAGSSSGSNNIANAPVNGTTLTATGVANGTYYVRVVSLNAVGPSVPSNEVVVTLPQQAPALVAGFQFFDPATQSTPTTVCRITSGINSTCELRSTSFVLSTNAIVSYEWTVQYTYGTAKTITQLNTSSTLSLVETCGGPGSTTDGFDQPLSVTLTVTDNLGNKATATAGSGAQPPLFLRLFKC